MSQGLWVQALTAVQSSDAEGPVVRQQCTDLSFPLCRPTLFEIQLGQVDRGATLRWISQFPGEDEVLLPPLSNLEVHCDAPQTLFCKATRSWYTI